MLFRSIQRVVGQNVKEMTGLDVVTVNVDVVDVLTKQEYAEKQQKAREDDKKQNQY